MRLSTFFALLGLLESIVSSPAQTNVAPSPPRSPSPRIEFAERVYDFGKVEAGNLVKHDFIFTNTGDALLEIRDVRASCGCTTVGAWDKLVKPGATGAIPVQFDAGASSGSVTKNVKVACNDPARSNVVLQILGTIWRPIEIVPAYVVFSLPPGLRTTETRVVKLVNNLDEPLTLSAPTNDNPAFRTELRTVQPGKEFELRITVVTPVGPGNMSASISMKTSSSRIPVIRVSALATVLPEVTATPAKFLLAQAPLTRPALIPVKIENHTTNTLVLTEPSVNAVGASVQLHEVQPGTEFDLTASFPAGFQRQPTQELELRVKSNFPKFPVIKVPVYQPLPPAAVPAPPPKSS
jgi:hypothetical protein